MFDFEISPLCYIIIFIDFVIDENILLILRPVFPQIYFFVNRSGAKKQKSYSNLGSVLDGGYIGKHYKHHNNRSDGYT